jgi:DNA-binding protein H-NS
MTEQKTKKIFEIVNELSTEEIKSLVERCQAELEHREHSEKKIAIAEIKAIADRAGLIVSFSDMGLLKRKAGPKTGTKAKIKYRNPVTGEEWCGRGLKPKWIIDFIAEGKCIEDYLTDEFRLPNS